MGEFGSETKMVYTAFCFCLFRSNHWATRTQMAESWLRCVLVRTCNIRTANTAVLLTDIYIVMRCLSERRTTPDKQRKIHPARLGPEPATLSATLSLGREPATRTRDPRVFSACPVWFVARRGTSLLFSTRVHCPIIKIYIYIYIWNDYSRNSLYSKHENINLYLSI